jgi:hypothetical protein
VRLEQTGSPAGVWSLAISPSEREPVHALAEFAKAGIAYDEHAAYVAQVFVYIMLQPRDLVRDPDTQAAFCAIDQVSAENRPSTGADMVIRLSKGEMRQLLMMLGMAAESEDQADIIGHAMKEEFPHRFPDLELASQCYAKAFEDLLSALYADQDLTVTWV